VGRVLAISTLRLPAAPIYNKACATALLVLTLNSQRHATPLHTHCILAPPTNRYVGPSPIPSPRHSTRHLSRPNICHLNAAMGH
jgi:hypothetical protein